MDLSYIINELGEERENYFNAISPPIAQTSNFQFKTVDEFRKALQDEMRGYLYSRGLNPTVEILRKKSGIQLIDRSNDSLQVRELDLSMREVSVDAKGPAEQGKLLAGAQMIVGTLASVNVEEKKQTTEGHSILYPRYIVIVSDGKTISTRCAIPDQHTRQYVQDHQQPRVLSLLLRLPSNV